MVSNQITVSVCMVAYNHEKYIAQAIESVLMQECDFKIELIISNDFSTDNTDLEITKLIERHPNSNVIKYENHKSNLGMMANFTHTLKRCEGKYIALLDGDDYWTDPLKLQKQVDFMEENPEYAICFHEVQIFNQQRKSLEEDTITKRVLPTTESIDLAQGNYIHTPSVLFRNNFNIPNWFSKSPLGDWTLYMLAATNGKVYKIEDTMAVYRQHEESIWSKKSNEYRISNTLKSFRVIDENLVLTEKAHHVLKETINLYKKQLYNLRKKTANTLVSICIPTYNGASFLEESLESVKRQTYNNIDVIVSDDASIDDTLAIVKKFKDGVDFPVTIISHKPNGIGANWNHCIKHAKGAYIKFLFQDDVLLPHCVERMVSIAESAENVGMVYCKRDIIYDESKTFDRNWVKNFKILHQSWKSLVVNEGVISGKAYIKDPNFLKHPVNKIGEPTAVLLHKSCFKKIGYFNTELKQALDIEYWYRIMPHFNIGFADEALIKFRLHEKQASQVNSKTGVNDKRLLPWLQLKYLFWHLPLTSKKYVLNRIWYLTEMGKFIRKVRRKLDL